MVRGPRRPRNPGRTARPGLSRSLGQGTRGRRPAGPRLAGERYRMTSSTLEAKPLPERTLSPAHGRLCVVLAALLWSTSGAFPKLLREATPLGLNQPEVKPLQIAFFRVL